MDKVQKPNSPEVRDIFLLSRILELYSKTDYLRKLSE
jgi:hypothetical protein